MVVVGGCVSSQKAVGKRRWRGVMKHDDARAVGLAGVALHTLGSNKVSAGKTSSDGGGGGWVRRRWWVEWALKHDDAAVPSGWLG
jgi:hypothetical protein